MLGVDNNGLLDISISISYTTNHIGGDSMRNAKVLKALKKAYTNTTKFPTSIIVKNPAKGILQTEFLVSSKHEILVRIKEIEQSLKGKYKCWLCNKYFSESGKRARWLPMDKREPGDGLFGDVFVCLGCVPQEYGRM